MISIQNLHIGNKQFSIFGSHLGLSKVSFTISKRPTSTSLFHHIIIRTMWSRYGNKAKNILMKNPTSQQPITQRHYPGHFTAVRYIKKGEPVKGGSGKTIPNHESYHVNLQSAKSKEIIGGFTTHPKPNEPNYHKISDQKLDGTQGEQFLGVYKNPKIITGDTKVIRELPELQSYLDQHEFLLNKIEKSKENAIREDRTSKKDSRFYNEDGTRDYENFPNK